MRSQLNGPKRQSAWGTESTTLRDRFVALLKRIWAVAWTAVLSFDRAAGTRQAAHVAATFRLKPWRPSFSLLADRVRKG